MSLIRVIGIAFLLLGFLQLGNCSSAGGNKSEKAASADMQAGREGERGKMDILTQKVLNKDPSATLLAKQLGPSASGSLIPLVTNADPVVREIALRCLEQSGGPDVARVFAEAVLDESASVRTAALTGLQKHVNGAVYSQLLNAYDKSSDGITREQIALLIGRVSGARIGDLKPKCETEKDLRAQDGCITALSKMGDRDSQSEFIRRLHDSKERERKRFLDYVSYVNQVWVLRALTPILRDKSPLLRIGVDGLAGHSPEYLRACDIAVNLIAQIGGVNFSFSVDQRTNYTDAQIDEALRFLDRLP